MKIRTCSACQKPRDLTCKARLFDDHGNPVVVIYCKPCIDKVSAEFVARLKKPEVEATEGAWSTATYDSD